MIKKVFLVLALVVLGYVGFSFFNEYMAYHGYYEGMLKGRQNGKTILSALMFGMIPTAYLMFSKKKNFWTLVVALLINLFLFGLTYIIMRAELLGGTIKFLINTILLFGIAIYTLVGFYMTGTYLKEKFLRLGTTAIFDVLINLGLGLAAFLVVTYVLVLLNIFHPVLTWLIFIVPILIKLLRARNWQDDRAIVEQSLHVMQGAMHHVWYIFFALPFVAFAVQSWAIGQVVIWTYVTAAIAIALITTYRQFSSKSGDRGVEELLSTSFWAEFLIFLMILLSIVYLDLGFMLAYIPYPTAWDANHAYMFFPKMWAAHNGYYWNEINMAVTPHLWYIYITFWFSLVQPFGSFFGISPDTVAIEMNFWSGIFVLLFGLGLISEVIGYLGHTMRVINRDARLYVLGMGWFMLLLWLMSGMGAFLVFIDNKTDLGVMALIILAMYSGFYFLRALAQHAKDENYKRVHRDLVMVIVLSGFFYAIAALAKPTAMFDVVNFGLFLRWIWFGILGVIGVMLAIIGALSAMKFSGIDAYIAPALGKWALALGGGVFIADVGRAWLKKLLHVGQYFLLWAGTFIISIVVIKGPYVVAHTLVYADGFSVGSVIKNILFSKAPVQSSLPTHRQIPLYAQTDSVIAPVADCSLSTLGLADAEALYTTIKSQEEGGDGYSEDVGRYIGYGWKGGTNDQQRGIKPFIDVWRGQLMSPGCHGFNPFDWNVKDAVALCTYETSWKALTPETFDTLSKEIPSDSPISEEFATLAQAAKSGGNPAQLRITYAAEFNAVDSFMQDNTIKVVSYDGINHVFVPYKYLNVFNISFNWSLQNLSSYYTDIGIMWIILILFVVIGAGYGIATRNHQLTGISVVTLCGWLLWTFVGGGILWYAIGIIIWTILSFIFFIYTLLTDRDQNNRLLATFLILGFFAFGMLQMVLNLARIASQGGGGAFIWYKTNNGRVEQFDESLNRLTPSTNRFGADDVFALQFPHYNAFLDTINTRKEDEGVYIAGTYARYFVKDQTNVTADNMLGGLWLLFSDNDPCKSYLRLKDKKIKYIVIDPNIGTVVQGAGNNTLFDRFFGKIDTTTNTIIDDGAFTMLAKLAQRGYVRHVTSNNIGAKYAFTMPDSTFGGMQGDALALFRARMAIMRFFGGTNTPMFAAAVDIATQRIKDGTFITDIAEIMGVQIREEKMLDLARRPTIVAADMADLTSDERKAFSQLLGIRQSGTDDAALKQVAGQILGGTIGAGNQLIVLEVVE